MPVTSPLTRTRSARHLALALVATATLVGTAAVAPPGTTIARVSLASAWLCLLAITAALALGPLRVLAGGQPMLNSMMRRDLGIWAGLTGLLHLYAGTVESMNQPYLEHHVAGEAGRQQLFNWGASLGFAVGLLVLVLLLISSNLALRLLGARWWKRLQRLAYAVLLLTVVHGILFQLLERRAAWAILLLVAVCAGLVGLQLGARRRWRRQRPTNDQYRAPP